MNALQRVDIHVNVADWRREDNVSDICSCMHHEFRLTSPWKTVSGGRLSYIHLETPSAGRDGKAKGSRGGWDLYVFRAQPVLRFANKNVKQLVKSNQGSLMKAYN